ncbi:hypothetical protein JW906_00555 [bacterium]|nr:hypothetical protein [bacterium]
MKIRAGGIIPAVVVLFLSGCGGKKKNMVENADPYTAGLPRFVHVNFIEPARMERISRFRSSVGHDYSDDFEHCRSMKHYFMPDGSGDWSEVRVYAPVDGFVSLFFDEWIGGTQIWLTSSEYPDFEFDMFHVHLRDLNPLTCQGETFISESGNLENGFDLN